MKWSHEKDNGGNSFKSQLLGIAKIAVPLTVVVVLLVFSLNRIERHNRETQLIQEFVKQERAFLDITALAIQQDIATMGKDLLTLKDVTAVENDNIKFLEFLFLKMAEHYGIYDQIRYIDEQGMEKVRINCNGDKAEVIPISQLQNKGDRYYFKNSNGLELNQIYISPLDLNVENGELDIPYKPMIRLATPVIDSSGVRHGVVVLNYLAENILGLIKSVYRGYDVKLSLVNQEGYFLIHEEDRTKEFGFMFDGGHANQLQNLDAEIYGVTEVTVSGWHRNSKGLFSFARLYPFATTSSTDEKDNDPHSPISSRSWLLITHVQQSTLDELLASNTRLSPLVGTVLALLILGVIVVLSYLLYKKNYEHKFVQYLAQVDQLTGCYNRNWGLELLQRTLAKTKQNQMVAVLFIDLDKFKYVNDTYGHKAGDAVLIESVLRIQNILRNDDSVVRLGGDEFLIILPAILEDNVPRDIPERIHAALRQPIHFGAITIEIDSSIGIALYPKDGTQVNELISLSDKAMYQAKTNKKDSYVLYGQPNTVL